VGIDFDPVDDAVDYRVYPLPPDGDVMDDGDGGVVVRNAVYRCAGSRETFDLQNNLNAGDTSLLRTRGQFSWNATVSDNPTLGYVYVTPGPDELPVYAVAGIPSNDEAGWRESRTKIYTTDIAERDRLLARNFRDDGVVFYVPRAPTSGTRTIYRSVSSKDPNHADAYQHYFDATNLAARADDYLAPVGAFEVLVSLPSAAPTAPLMVVGYDNSGHDELAVGKERFARAAHQGKGPLWHLEWSGIDRPTTLVIEALASGCPYQGFLSPTHVDAPPHQTFETLNDIARAAPTGEVFINGQFDEKALPKAVARSFVQVSPSKPATDWDWHEGFDGSGALRPLADLPTSNCFHCVRQQTSKFEVNFVQFDIQSDTNVFAFGEVLGQLWLGYDDNAGGSLGKGQFTALKKAQIDADPSKYLHVAFSANSASTLRRYPQLIVSDQDPPSGVGLENPDNNTLIFEPRGGPLVTLLLFAVHGLTNGHPWAVDNPETQNGHVLDEPDPSGVPSALDPPFEHVGADRMTKYDVYVSSSRFYAFLDGKPAGCTVLPSAVDLVGAVSVTFGDIFFDEAAEGDVCLQSRPYDFRHRHSCTETSRHFDDLGFRSGASLPPWDENRFPCSPY
jgi:hypothetical protein